MVCHKCGVQNSEMQKFCGKCGAMTEASVEQNLEGQAQENLGQAPEQPQVQTLLQSEEQFSGQAPEQPQGQTLWQSEEQFSGQDLAHIPEQFSGHVLGHAPEHAPEYTPGHIPEYASGHTSEHSPEPSEPKKKPLGVIVGIAVALVAIIVAVILFSRTNVADEMKGQLEELDSTSYCEIRDWVENDFAQYFEEYFDLTIEAIDETEEVLDNTFLDDDDRFIEWSFYIDTEEEQLFIKLIYEEIVLTELLRLELEELNQSSLRDILDWMDRVEEEHGDFSLLTQVHSVDGDWVDPSIVSMENEDLFVEWTVNFQDDFFMSAHVEMIFNTIRTFNFGDTFEADGLEIAFKGTIRWGIVDDAFSADDGADYFKVPVTITNVSNTTSNIFSPRLYAPDGTQIRTLLVIGVDDNIALMGGLRPDGTQSGYLYVRFLGDGDYVMEIRDFPLMVEVVVPMNSRDFQREREELLAALEPDEVIWEEVLIGRWVAGIGDTLLVFGNADPIEFREDGTLLIIEDDVERTTTWESSNWDEEGFGDLYIDGVWFFVLVDDDILVIMDEEDNIKSWLSE